MTADRSPAVVVINADGCAAGAAVARALSAGLYVPTRLRTQEFTPAEWALFYSASPREQVQRLFQAGHDLVLVMATGVAVRFLSGLPRDKHTDPPVVVLDTAARYAISLLAGHEGGANDLAYRVAAVVGAEPVVTTGTESHRTVVAGVGCRRGLDAGRIMEVLQTALALAEREQTGLRVLATAAFKADEPGIQEVCKLLGVGLRVFSREAIQSVEQLFGESQSARKYFDVGGVAEPCAFLAAHQGRIILPRLARNGVTVALAEDRLWSPVSGRAIKRT